MQAADLLSLLVPGLTAGAAQPGAPGAAVGKGGLALGKAGQGADAKDGPDATNPFAEALAALMAAQCQIAPTPAAAPVTGETPAVTESEPTQEVADPANKGLQTALAATAKAGAPAKGLAKLVGAQNGAAENAAAAAGDPKLGGAQAGDADPAPAAATATGVVAPATGETVTNPGASGLTAAAKTLPDQSQAPEALADRLATPSPRSDRANEVANGPHLPAWVRPGPAASDTPATPQAPAAAPASTGTAPVADAAEPLPPVAPTPVSEPAAATVDQAAASLAGAQVAAQGSGKISDPTPSARPDGKAKDQEKGDDDNSQDVHAPPRGIGKGLATAPGQLKKASGDQGESESTSPDAGTSQTAAADKSSTDNTAAAPLAAADAARANAVTPAHADRLQASSHTVAHLVEQIADKADGKSTRFDVTLDPAGLGKVDVKIEIGRDGGVSAALTFDNPQAAAELKSRAGELRTALEQAGFDLSKGGLSFDLSGQNQGRNLWDQQDQAPQPSWARASFVDLAQAADPPGLSRHRTIDAGGVDVTV